MGEPTGSPSQPGVPEPDPAGRVRAPLRAVLGYFLGLGTWGFGGPIATVGYMQRDLVERRGWLDRDQFLGGVALGQTMPGPLAAQVAMWVGFLARGALGALAVAGAFIAPSFLAVLAVAVAYVRNQGLPVVQSLLYGVAPAVMAIIALAAPRSSSPASPTATTAACGSSRRSSPSSPPPLARRSPCCSSLPGCS
jgi:chromate transporter